MEESHRSLFAVRVVRPYQTEDEFLREEAFALTASSIVLVGAGPRTDGVILRFEVVLESGAILLRGEGRVAGHVPTPRGEGLLLRFTRLDPRSKALVDRASPRSAAEPSVVVSASMPPPPPAAPSSRPTSVPPFPGREPTEAAVPASPPEPSPPPPSERATVESAAELEAEDERATLTPDSAPPPAREPVADRPDPSSPAPRAPGLASTRPPDARAAALERLRARLRGEGAAERLALLGIDVPAAKR